MSKVKGSRAERELFHKLWDEGYAVVRAAGSGSTTKPAPDLLASNGKKRFAIECKSLKGKRKYFAHEEIEQLLLFASTFGAEPWLGIRFDSKGWFFFPADKVQKSKGEQYVVSFVQLQKEGLQFEEFVEKFVQKKIL